MNKLLEAVKEAIAIVDELITCEMDWSDDKIMKAELQKAWNKIREEVK